MSAHDLIIRGGTVVDGTGAPARARRCRGRRRPHHRRSDRSTAAARRTIDADGLLVTPGFVDIHTHYDGQASWGERMIPSSWHGVTTVVAGNCGVGFAPVHPTDHYRLIELMEGVEDIPGAVLDEGSAVGLAVLPRVHGRARRSPVRRRRRGAGARTAPCGCT